MTEVKVNNVNLNITEEEVQKLKRPEVIPTLYDINKSFDYIKTQSHDGIKGEHHARMVVFTNYVLGRKCVILTGPSFR
jgi:hypothetical protein